MQQNLEMYNRAPVFGFNSATDPSGSYKIPLDNNGTILDEKPLEYGVYNKIINIKISKILYIKKKYVGFGDIIDFFTKLFYIKNVIVYLTNGNCGCEARRKKFNKLLQIPYFIFGIRELYAQDIQKVELSKRRKKKNKPKVEKNIKFVRPEDGKVFSPSDVVITNSSNNINNKLSKGYTHESIKDNLSAQQNKQPITPNQIRGGCGCRKK